MKKIIKRIAYFLTALVLAFVVFFFWASSPTLDPAAYQTLQSNDSLAKNTNDSVFSIMTYNIGYLSGMTNNRPIAKPKSLFDINLQTVLTQLSATKPDIIAFQEIDYNASRSYFVNQQEAIAKMGYAFRAKAINWDEKYVPFPYWPIKMNFGKVVSGQSILSKYPLAEHQRIVLQRVADAPFYRAPFYLERLAQVVKVRLQNKEVVLINVHLEAFDKPTREKQFYQVLQLFNQYKNEYPTILLGDFNSRARDKDAIIQQLFNIQSLGNAAFTAANPINTFDTQAPFERIDYIFYTKNTIEYIAGSVVTSFGKASDHLPVLMQFKLK